jgi:hypothetical protein
MRELRELIVRERGSPDNTFTRTFTLGCLGIFTLDTIVNFVGSQAMNSDQRKLLIQLAESCKGFDTIQEGTHFFDQLVTTAFRMPDPGARETFRLSRSTWRVTTLEKGKLQVSTLFLTSCPPHSDSGDLVPDTAIAQQTYPLLLLLWYCPRLDMLYSRPSAAMSTVQAVFTTCLNWPLMMKHIFHQSAARIQWNSQPSINFSTAHRP